jgi:hypothetical protein
LTHFHTNLNLPGLMRPTAALPFLAALLVGACGDANFLNPATSENAVINVRLWAIQGTPIHLPTAWSVPLRTRIRMDQNANFDFAFDIDPTGRAVLLPRGAFGLTTGSGNPGLFTAATAWDEITVAPINGYLVSDTIPVTVGQILYVRSAVSGVCFASYALYGKMEILDIDTTARSLGFRILTNANCGYKSLELGLPTK